jgi:AcrR family transcriptional regulator
MRAATSSAIEKAALRIVRRKGSAAVTMREVAGAIGITAMAIYRHYPNRDALLNALAAAGFAELTAALEKKRFRGSPSDRLLGMMDLYMEFSIANPRLFELMFLEKRAGARRFPADFIAGHSPTANLVAEVLAEGMKSGHFRKDDLWEIAFGLGALAHGLTQLYLGERIDASPARFRNLYRRAFRRHVDGLRA